MFLSLKSPKGGNSLSQMWLKQARVKKPSLRLDIDQSADIIEDKWAYKIGYCDSCGEHMYITVSVAEIIYKMLFKVFR